jgi:hypothetical protein
VRVEVEIYEDEVENDDGYFVSGLRLTCNRCGHEVTASGTSDGSARYGAVKLSQECPNGERNYYIVNWEG